MLPWVSRLSGASPLILFFSLLICATNATAIGWETPFDPAVDEEEESIIQSKIRQLPETDPDSQAAVQEGAIPPLIRLGFTSYRPYSWRRRDTLRGIEIEVLDYSLREKGGYNLEYIVLPWKRVQRYVETGAIDGFVATRTDTRDAFAKAGDVPVTFWWLSAFVRKSWLDRNQLNIKSFTDLAPHRIAALRGNSWIELHSGNFDVEWVNDMEQLIPLLLRGRVDAVPANPIVIQYYADPALLRKEVTEIRLEDGPIPLYLYISKRSPAYQLLSDFDRLIRNARNEGVLDVLLMQQTQQDY